MRNQRSIIEESSKSASRRCKLPTLVDMRWVSLPIMGFLAYTIGDVSLWVIGLVLVGSFGINLRF